jgi:hypothetical protein
MIFDILFAGRIFRLAFLHWNHNQVVVVYPIGANFRVVSVNGCAPIIWKEG